MFEGIGYNGKGPRRLHVDIILRQIEIVLNFGGLLPPDSRDIDTELENLASHKTLQVCRH